MTFLVKVVLIVICYTFVKADFPIESNVIYTWGRETDSSAYRLPEVLDPIHYDVEITPYFEAEDGREEFTFYGEVTILVKALEDGITRFVLHENVRHIHCVTVTDLNDVHVIVNGSHAVERIRQYQFLSINLRDGVTLTKNALYKIKIDYTGNINETPLSRGVFRGRYKNKLTGKTHYYAATHLQPTHSRQAFPSFDEPGFKSTFNIVINRKADFTDTYSNMPMIDKIPLGERVKEIFQTTPRMSAYLVTFHISEEFTVIADNNDTSRPYKILARPDAEGQGEYALDVGVKITSWLENYFGIPYYTMGDENMKNDQIASPDWASGATENWGLVTYREVRLLYEENETNDLDKMYIGTITAHELAHKWFGNLITCRWWDNVWINEGFASYFEYFAMDGVDKSMELEDQFNLMYVQSALSADSATNTRALQHNVNSPEEVTGHFSGISYSKGASLLMMLKHFLTEDTFKKALNIFLLDRSFEHAFPEDLYAAFEIAVKDDEVLEHFPTYVNITRFIEIWVNEQGYPVLDVNFDSSTGLINLQQERFYISATANPTEQFWYLPITYTTKNNPNWSNTRATHVMMDKTDTITVAAGNEWVIFNIKQNGIYRVNYDINTWNNIAAELQTTKNIHYLNRAQIVDDVFALMRSEKLTYELGFEVLKFLKEEVDYYVWYPAISGFTWLRNRFLHLPRILQEYDELIYEYLNNIIEDLGYDEGVNDPHTKVLNRFFVMAFACSIGHKGCVDHAVETFKLFSTTGVNPNLRRHIYCSGLLAGDYNTWQSLYNRRLESNNQADEVVMLRALGCTKNAEAIEKYLEMVLSNDVRAQDRVNAFTFLFMGDRENAKIALQFIKNHPDEIREAVIGTVRFNTVISSLAGYLDEEGLIDMENWLNENPSMPEYSTGINAISTTRQNMQWGTERSDSILRALRGSATILMPSAILLLAAIVHFLK